MKPRPIAQTHSISFILYVAFPVVVCLAVFGMIFRREMLRNAESQLYATVEQTSSGINTEFENMAVMTASLIHDRTLMEKSLAYCRAFSVRERYQASFELDRILEKMFLATNLKGSIYLVLDGKEHNGNRSIYVNRNYQTLSMGNQNVAALADRVGDTVDKVRCAARLFRERNTTETRPVAILVSRPPVDRGYVTGIDTVIVAFASSSIYHFLYSSLVRDTGISAGEKKFIVGADGKILAASDDASVDMQWLQEKKMLGKNYLIIVQPVKMTGWSICSAVPVRIITGKVEIVMKVVGILLVCIILFFIMYNVAFFRSEVRPLKNVIDSMGNVAQGDFSVRLPHYRFLELDLLSRSFNAMTCRLDELTAQIRQEQKERLKTEIKALRFQLNPHFMCNTLNTIRMMAMMAKNDAITKMSTALMFIMEDNLRDDSSFSSLKHELQNLEYYVYVMQVRYGREFDYYCTVSQNLMDLAVPSMTLQPLVENAIIHGIRGIGRPGTITVSASRILQEDKDILRIDVADNGCGMDADKLSHIFEAASDSTRGLNHIGLQAVYRRIRLLFGGSYTVQISSFPGEGTVVSVYIPAAVFKSADDGRIYDENSHS